MFSALLSGDQERRRLRKSLSFAVSLRTPSWAEDWIVFCRCVPHLSGKPHEPCRRAGKGQKLSAILVCGSA